MSVVSLKSVGPIEAIEFDLPENSGGVKVFRGSSGAGKTTALRALAGLTGDKDALSGLTPHDGEERGEVSGLGRNVKIGSRVTTGGASTVPHLSKVDISVLVEPRVMDPAARTKARVRCLVMLGGKTVTAKDLLQDSYERYANDIDLDDVAKDADPVAMADKIKRAIDTRALEREREAERVAGMAMAKRQEAGDIDELQAAANYEEAVEEHRTAMGVRMALENQQKHYREATERNKSIDERLAVLEKQIGPTIKEMLQRVDQCKAAVDNLKSRLALAEESLRESVRQLTSAQERDGQICSLRESRMDPGTLVSDAEIAEATDAEAAALAALTAMSNIDRRKAALAESLELSGKAEELHTSAKTDRMIGTLVQSRVQSALPEGPIQVEDGQLVVAHGRRKKAVSIDELSTGERWKVALAYAVGAVGSGGVIPICQEAWQALGYELREQIAEQCKEARVWVISAAVDEGPLRIEDYSA